MPSPLEIEFNESMVDIYRRAADEAGYKATRFFQMVREHGGIAAAKMLLASTDIPSGYTTLLERKRLDLTMEAMILKESKYHELFSPDELAKCDKRLVDCGYNFNNQPH